MNHSVSPVGEDTADGFTDHEEQAEHGSDNQLTARNLIDATIAIARVTVLGQDLTLRSAQQASGDRYLIVKFIIN